MYVGKKLAEQRKGQEPSLPAQWMDLSISFELQVNECINLLVISSYQGVIKAVEYDGMSSFFYKLHTSELEDGYEWGRLNLQSVTEQNQLDDFLATAELAGTEFTAEKLNIEVRPAAQRSCSNMYCLLFVHSLKL